MQRIEDNLLALIAARMTGNDLPAAADHHRVDIVTNPNVLVAEGDRNGVVVGPVAHQRLRGDPTAGLVAGLERRCRQRAHRRQIALHPLADRLALAAQPVTRTFRYNSTV